jgi:hypothetical protein
MVPDYSLPIRDLYISFTKQYILHHECLDIICAPQVRCIKPLEGGLRSWVPGWRTTSYTNCYIRPEVLPMAGVNELQDLDVPIYQASHSTKSVISFFEKDKWLVCGGMLVDTVSFVSHGSTNAHDWYAIVLDHCQNSGQRIPEEKLNRDFWSMIIGDETSSWEFSPVKGGVHWLGGKQEGKAYKMAQVFFDRNEITPTIKGRSFIVMENGFMGLAPTWVEVRDTLAILFGCNMPILSGKCTKDLTHFHLKGDCFVQGWMRGEMLEALGDATDEEIVERVVGENPGIEIR